MSLTHSCVWQDSFLCVPWLIRVCDKTHSYVCHDSFVYVTMNEFSIQICLQRELDSNEWVMSHTWLSHGTHKNESCHTYEWVMCHICGHVTHVNGSCHTNEWVMSHIWTSHVTHNRGRTDTTGIGRGTARSTQALFTRASTGAKTISRSRISSPAKSSTSASVSPSCAQCCLLEKELLREFFVGVGNKLLRTLRSVSAVYAVWRSCLCPQCPQQFVSLLGLETNCCGHFVLKCARRLLILLQTSPEGLCMGTRNACNIGVLDNGRYMQYDAPVWYCKTFDNKSRGLAYCNAAHCVYVVHHVLYAPGESMQMQCVAVCWQCVAVCCSVWQETAWCCICQCVVLHVCGCFMSHVSYIKKHLVACGILGQDDAHGVLPSWKSAGAHMAPVSNPSWFTHIKCVAVCCSVLQCAAVCCSVLQCVAVCCSVL